MSRLRNAGSFGLPVDQQRVKIAEMSEARGQVRAEITEVLSKRWAFLQEQLSADQRGQAAPTLVESLVAAMRQQAADAGLTFDACAAPSAE